MKIFHKDGNVIAVHLDTDTIDASAYGTDASILTVSDDTVLEKVGPAPEQGKPDTRPFKLPIISSATGRVQAKAAVITAINKFTENFTAGYSQSEMLSWGTKDIAARAYIAGETLNESQLALLNSEKEAGKYESLDTLCAVIVKNSDNFVRISGTIAGIRVSSGAAIDKARDNDEIAAIVASVEKSLTDFAKTLSA